MADDAPVLPVVIDSLALALVASSEAPSLLLNGRLEVVAASNSFSKTFQIEPSSVPGASIFALGGGEWDVPQLHSLLAATVSGAADIEHYEMDLQRDGQGTRHLVITAHLLDHGDETKVMLLMEVTDVTDTRAAERLKDNLIREKALLFQELQHRVANSLQIIASVLMQSARRVPEASRSLLVEAHNRVISVASLQQMLATSSLGDVDVRAYLTQLCQSIGASMIPDPGRVTLTVVADEGWAKAETSVSLGLVVTELVINALKYAFPDGRSGHVEVRYHRDGDDWTLSVGDDGVGIATAGPPPKSGLGTSIVQALTKQLGATIEVAGGRSGTLVTLTHAQSSAALREASRAKAI